MDDYYVEHLVREREAEVRELVRVEALVRAGHPPPARPPGLVARLAERARARLDRWRRRPLGRRAVAR